MSVRSRRRIAAPNAAVPPLTRTIGMMSSPITSSNRNGEGACHPLRDVEAARVHPQVLAHRQFVAMAP